MAEFRFVVTVETENELSSEAQERVKDDACAAAADSARNQGGGESSGDGVIEGG